jgi:tetratricopeptide (TPR) repeat protein
MWLSTEMLGNYEESILFYEEIIDRDPYSWQIWYNYGHALACLERYLPAADAFEYACIIHEENEHAWRDQAEMRLQLGQTDRAVDCLLTALDKAETRDPELLTRLGEAYEKHGQHDQARKTLREALALDPGHDEAHFRLGCLLLLQEKLESAVYHLETAIDIQNEREEYYVALAEAYFQQGFLAQAEMCLHRALELAPEQSSYWLQYASFLLQNGSLEEALDILDSAISQQRSPQLDYARIACLFRLGKRQEACQSLCLQLAEDYNAHQTLFELAPELSSDPDVISLVRAFRLEE